MFMLSIIYSILSTFYSILFTFLFPYCGMLTTQLAILIFGYVLLLTIAVYWLHWLSARHGLKWRNWYTVVRIVCLLYAALYLVLPAVFRVEGVIQYLSLGVMLTAVVNIEHFLWHPKYPRLVRGLYALLFTAEHFMATFFFIIVVAG